jgi:chemotaxis protein histidine kinase CheA
MAPTKPEKPDIVTYANHEVITPDQRSLRKAAVPARPTDEDPVARAEKALAQLSSEYGAWMNEECELLDAGRRQIREAGLTKANCNVLFRAAHDVKGNAETFGYPKAAPAADSLCRLLEHTPDMIKIPLQLIDQHIDAIRAIVREQGRPDIAEIAAVLTKRLRQVTEEFLALENRHRPDYLKAFSSPSLAPGEQF